MVNRDAQLSNMQRRMSDGIRKNKMVQAQHSSKITEKLKIRKYIEKLGGYDILVGVPAEKDVRNDGEPITNSELIYIHTHGVDRPQVRNNIRNLRTQNNQTYAQARNTAQQLYRASMGDPVHMIPPRPILEPAITANKEEINKRLKNAMNSFLSGNEEKGIEDLKRLGMFAQNKAREWFTDSRNGWTPLSPATKKAKAKKGKSKDNPLIDTGEMRKSITYVLVTPENNVYVPRTQVTESRQR